MTKSKPIGYCPYCEKKVSLKREGINVPLAILLGIFTGGIGLLIYLAIYYHREEDRCVECRSRIFPVQIQVSSSNDQPNSTLPATKKRVEEVKGERLYFCPLCGERLNGRNVRVCPNCGSKVNLK